MQFRAVSLVLTEAILGKAGAEVTHHHVTRDLGDNARSSDAQGDAIAVNDRGLRQRKWRNG